MTKKYKKLKIWIASIAISVLVLGVLIEGNMVGVGISVSAKTSEKSASPATTYVVDTTSDLDQSDCTSAPNDCSLRFAVAHANGTLANDTITFAIPPGDPGCVDGVCTINPRRGEIYADRVELAGTLTITGTGANQIRISGGDLHRIFNVEVNANLTLNNITLTNGLASLATTFNPGRGGCILNRGRVNLVHSTVSNCTATTVGGGIYNNGVLTVTDSTIRDNSADSRDTNGGAGGGGIFNVGFLEINRSAIAANRVIVNAQGALALGGGIHNFGSTITSTTLHIINSTISGNVASGLATNSGVRGAGIYNVGGGSNNNMFIVNSTITANLATLSDVAGEARGGGIFTADTSAPAIKNTIIAGNTVSTNFQGLSPDGFGSFSSGGYNLIGKSDGANGFTSIGDQFGSILVPLDPRLAPLANNGGPAMTHALCTGVGAPHATCTGVSSAVDKGSAADDPIFELPIRIDQRSKVRPFDNQAVSPAPNGNNSDIGAFELRSRGPIFDFDGDGKTDVGIFRPSVGEWWYQRSSNGQVAALQFGTSTDKMVPGDFTGDGKADIAVWRPSNGQWFVLRSEDGSFFALPFGSNGDIPAPADYDGDGRTDPAVFRPSTTTWFISNSGGGGVGILNFGLSTDKPVVADYDGDSKADIAIWRAGPGEWWGLRSSNNSVFAVQFGATSDRPVQGDYTGDGKADIAFWRPADGNWFIIRSEDSSYFAFPFGSSGDTPVPGDYDGDGRQDSAVFRPSNATWFLNRSTAGVAIQRFGLTSDMPMQAALIP